MTWEDAVQSLIDDPGRRELVEQCYFDLPLLAAAERYHASPEWASVRRHLPRKPDRALDVGAGNGIVSFALARDGWRTTAVEPDPSPLVGAAAVRNLASQSGLAIETVEGVTNDLDASDHQYDAVLVRQVFHHAPDIDAFAHDLARLLKPGGTLITWRDHVISRAEDLPAFFDRHPLHHAYGGENAFRTDEYRAALEKAGLRVIEQLRHFDDPMNYGPQTPAELFRQAIGDRLPEALGNSLSALLGSGPAFALLAPLLSAIDRRPGRHVAFVARRED